MRIYRIGAKDGIRSSKFASVVILVAMVCSCEGMVPESTSSDLHNSTTTLNISTTPLSISTTTLKISTTTLSTRRTSAFTSPFPHTDYGTETKSDEFQSQFVIQHSSLFMCFGSIYTGDEMVMIFPPSERIIDIIQNVSYASKLHRLSMDAFCRKSKVFTRCVLKAPQKYSNNLIKKFINLDNFENVVSAFCRNREIIASQFECTYETVKASRCGGGGLRETLTLIGEAMSSPFYGNVCRNITRDMDCRVNKQLKPCNGEYAYIMNHLYRDILSDKCLNGEYIAADNPNTDIMPCMYEYISGYTKRFQAMVSDGTKKTISDYIPGVFKEIDTLCSGVLDDILSCIDIKLQTSSKPTDAVLKRVISINNLRKIMRYACSKRSVFKQHAECAVTSVAKLGAASNTSHNKPNCILRVSSTFSFYFNASTTEQTKSICRMVDPYGECLTPVLQGCNKELAETFKTIVRYISKSCGKPTYVLDVDEEGKSSGVNGMKTSGIVAALFLIVPYLFAFMS